MKFDRGITKYGLFTAAMLSLAVLAAIGIPTDEDQRSFTYIGQLSQQGIPYSGSADVTFTLWDAHESGSTVSTTRHMMNITITDGMFKLPVSFNNTAFANNATRWLEVSVRAPSGKGSFTKLTPRQLVKSSGHELMVAGGERDTLADDGVGISSVSPWKSDNNGIHYKVANVGIGTNSDSSSNLYVRGDTAIFARSDSRRGKALFGLANSTTGKNFGVYGQSKSNRGRGVFGMASSPSGVTYGVYGKSQSTNGLGVYGEITATTGFNAGVWGETASSGGRGVFGWATATTGTTYGVAGQCESPDGRAVFAASNSPTGTTYGVYASAGSPNGRGVFGWVTASTGFTYGVHGKTRSTSGLGVYGESTASSGANYGVWGQSASNAGRGIFGFATSGTGTNFGVYGRSNSATGWDFWAGGNGGDYGSSSSRRWKNNIENIDNPLKKIAQLRGVYFDWDEEHGGQHDVGMIAEEVGAILPEIVTYEENGIDAIGMDYSKMTPLLVEAVNALRAELDSQLASRDSRLASIERENKELRTRNADLESRLTQIEAIMFQLNRNQIEE